MLQEETTDLIVKEIEATLTMIVTWRKAVAEIANHVTCTGEYPIMLSELLEASFKSRERGLSDIVSHLNSLPF